MNHAKGNGLTAINSQPAKSHNQDTNDMNFATGTRNSKAESNLRAILATAGHAVPCERIRTQLQRATLPRDSVAGKAQGRGQL